MKKEIFAAALLLLLVLLSVFNFCYFNSRVCHIQRLVFASGRAAGQGDFEKAQSDLSSAYSMYLKFSDYAGLFTECSKPQQRFGELRAALSKRELVDASLLYALINQELEQLAESQGFGLNWIF